MRGLRCRVRKLPKPRISILSPALSDFTMLSNMVSTMISESLRLISTTRETSSINSALVIVVSWCEDFFFQAEDGIRDVLADDKASLMYLTNLGCIDQNPWMSRVGSLDRPDYILIDLDPYQCDFDKVVEAALLV